MRASGSSREEKQRPQKRPTPASYVVDVICIGLSVAIIASSLLGRPVAPLLLHWAGLSTDDAWASAREAYTQNDHSHSQSHSHSHSHSDSLLSEHSFAAQSSVRRGRQLLSIPGRGDTSGVPEWASDIPRLTIFCAPKPYAATKDDMQRRALLSWLRLRPQPQVVLLGNDPSFLEVAREFPGAVSVDPYIDYNLYGVPLFHSMLARAQAADTPVSMILNGDIVLLRDVMPALGRIHSSFENYLITAARWDVAEDFPFSFEAAAWGRGSEEEREAEIWRYVRSHGSLHSYGGVDLWMWNNSPAPLFSGHMPPFAYGRGKFDNWFIHEAIAAGHRQVVDASTAMTCIHVAHSYSHVKVETGATAGNFWSTRKKSSWELFANIHMAETTGTYTNQKGTALHAPWKLANCDEPQWLNMCLMKRERPANCTCEYSPYVQKTQSDPRLHKSGQFWVCGVVSVDKKSDYTISAVAQPNSTLGLPHTLDQILPQVALEIDNLKVVTLVAVTFGYAEMLMNFVCNLRRLGLAGNLVVAALDEDLYELAFLQGLAVYYDRPFIDMKKFDPSECQFGTPCFRNFTKLKSRAVLRVLRAGYSVLWSDVDIVWFKNPLPDLLAFGPGTLPIQSNEPNAAIPGTGIRRINSGFYFARSDRRTIKAFEAIVAHAAMTRLSEQPSFYDVLCGEKGELLVDGGAEEACIWKNGLKTIFLDRKVYPNGAVYGYWNASDVAKACAGCSILHNNWISGRDAKMARVVDNQFWFYDSRRRMCLYSWSVKLPKEASSA